MAWAACVSQLAGIFANLSPHETAWKQDMDAINFFMRDRGCDKALQERVREYFIASRALQRRQRERRVFELMSPSLQGEVAMVALQRIVSSVYYFRAATAGFVLALSRVLTSRGYAQREMIWSVHLNIMHQGMAAVRGAIKLRGRVWNEDIILDNPTLRRTGPACALTFVETFELSRQDLDIAHRSVA